MARSAANPEELQALADAIDEWCDDLRPVAFYEPTPRSTGVAAVVALVRSVAALLAQQLAAAMELRATRMAFLAADRRRSAVLLRGRTFGVDLAVAGWHLFNTGVNNRVNTRVNNRVDTRVSNGVSATAQHLVVADAARGHLLRFDPRGDGRVVEVLGDLASAEHIAVLIPGMTNDIGNYLADHRTKAQHLLAAMRAEARPGERVAVISWLGYDTPDGLVSAGFSSLAKAGAAELRRDLELLVTLNSHAHVTVIGHSYGSVVLGQAMRRGLPPALHVSDAIAVGSPGMDATDRRELGSPNVTLHATRTRTRRVGVLGLQVPVPADVVPLAPAHGEDPAVPGFHAHPFPADGVTSHGGYFNPGTLALLGMARIATTRPRRRRPASRTETPAPGGHGQWQVGAADQEDRFARPEGSH